MRGVPGGRVQDSGSGACLPIAGSRCAEFPERRRRRRGPDSSPAPHRNSPWSDRRGLAGGAVGHWPRPVLGAGSPRAAASPSGSSAASPSPMPSLLPGPRRWRLKLCAERATSGHPVRFLPLAGVTAVAADRGARLGLLGRLQPGLHRQKLGKCFQRHLLPCSVAPRASPRPLSGS